MSNAKDKPLNMVARVPQSLVKLLDKAAKDGARSRSAEVRVRLERSLREMPVFTGISQR